MMDYVPMNQLLTFQSNVLMCANVTITDDSVVEDVEVFQVILSSSDPDVIIGTNGTAAITILDNDGTDYKVCVYNLLKYSSISYSAVVVGLTRDTYPVMESAGEVVVCAELTGSIARPVTVRLSTASDTAEEGSDFTSLTSDMMTFQPSQQSEDVCWTIRITNDSRVEGTEVFHVSLDTDDTSVTLNPNTAQIVIMEEDCKYHSFCKNL